MQPLIIIGAGLAGWTTVRELRKRDATAPVLLITADSGDFYAKPSLSNAFAQGRSPAQLVSTPAAKLVETQNVTLLAHTRVQAIDPVRRVVTTSHGKFVYRDLMLATGAQAMRVPLAGDAADRVLSVNSLQDFSAFHCRLVGTDSSQNHSKHIVIMGAGLIGCEFANDLAGQRTELVFPLMPVTIKTPALPIVVAAPAPGLAGQWTRSDPSLWQFMGAENRQHDFVLTGQHTARRGEQARLVQV